MTWVEAGRRKTFAIRCGSCRADLSIPELPSVRTIVGQLYVEAESLRHPGGYVLFNHKTGATTAIVVPVRCPKCGDEVYRGLLPIQCGGCKRDISEPVPERGYHGAFVVLTGFHYQGILVPPSCPYCGYAIVTDAAQGLLIPQ